MPTPVIVRARPGRPSPAPSGRNIETYRRRRDFAVSREPAPRPAPGAGGAAFVVQKHAARRLHWDFRLEHGGVLWSWAVPRGPSLDPADKRLAVHVEDHPVEYADFHGEIPPGQYGAGTVEIWDRGTWTPLGDPDEGMRNGELKFVLAGKRLHGGFVLVRLKQRPKEHAENWLLIKERDGQERAGADAAALEAGLAAPTPRRKRAEDAPVPGAVRGALPQTQSPQLAMLVERPPEGPGWVSEVKFDGYRMLAFLDAGRVRLLSRNGNDWTARVPAIAEAVKGLKARTALVDGEMVALRPNGVSDFGALKAALSDGRDRQLVYCLFDLLHLDGWDLRPGRLADRKAALRGLADWGGALRFSEDAAESPARMLQQACAGGLEGIVCKQVDAPYRGTRASSWLKLKCQDRKEFIVLGWTRSKGSRAGLGALHLGFYDPTGALHYAGGVGTGFSDRVLRELRQRLDALAAPPPERLLISDEKLDRGIAWVRPELVGEVRYLGWTDGGRLRHSAWLGLREDMAPAEVVREAPAAGAPRHPLRAPSAPARIVQAVPAKPAAKGGRMQRHVDAPATVVARRPARGDERVGGVRLTHAERELWPGITKRALAEYWQAVAEHALPEIAGRPLALVRCPEGIGGEHFFQKHARPGFPRQIRAGESAGAPWLAVDDLDGLVACAQVSAIELHAWGAGGADPLHPDRLVFDLDPGEGVGMPALVEAAREVRERLERAGLAAFCRTSGGKGLHVLAPLVPGADWDTARAWCRGFAEAMEAEHPDRYVSQVSKAKRQHHILIDWLRNGLGATAVASFSPRARPGAGVAMRLAWREVTERLDPAAFTLGTVPARLARSRKDPWEGFAEAARPLPGTGGA
jgi:bifunctional non-homologous end joining protein LigD